MLTFWLNELLGTLQLLLGFPFSTEMGSFEPQYFTIFRGYVCGRHAFKRLNSVQGERSRVWKAVVDVMGTQDL